MSAAPHCSFCGKGSSETELMMAGSWPAFICAECIDDAYAQKNTAIADRKATEQLFAEARKCTFCTPGPISLTHI